MYLQVSPSPACPNPALSSVQVQLQAVANGLATAGVALPGSWAYSSYWVCRKHLCKAWALSPAQPRPGCWLCTRCKVTQCHSMSWLLAAGSACAWTIGLGWQDSFCPECEDDGWVYPCGGLTQVGLFVFLFLLCVSPTLVHMTILAFLRYLETVKKGRKGTWSRAFKQLCEKGRLCFTFGGNV